MGWESRFGRVKKEKETLYSPVVEVGVEAPEAAPDVAADTLEAAVESPATVSPPAVAELAVAVAPAEAGQLAAEGSLTLTLYQDCYQ